MKRNRLLIAGVILFIGVNILLVYLDEDQTIKKKSYVSEWSEVFTANLYNKTNKPGVLSATASNDVYFDKSLGGFQEFLVEKGTQVKKGDDLYTYRVHSFYETKTYLTSELSRLDGEIEAIEEAINDISSYRIRNVPVHIITENENKENGEIIIPARQSAEAEYMKEQYLTEKEKELAKVEAEKRSVETQLTELESGGNTITVESPYQGKVSLVSEALGDPIITISSRTLRVIGELTEKESTVIKEGMPVEVAINESNAMVKGQISNISELPNEIDLHEESDYPFSVSFAEGSEVENLLPGYHANLAIITKQSEDATALFEDSIFSGSVWKMTIDGELDNQKIETGLEMGSIQEITKNAKPGEWVAKKPKEAFRYNTTFVTPLKFNKIQVNDIFNIEHKGWSELVVTGLLSR
ncbi:HlyD family efflux transporter periplasmic adaptor subunit [Virgibacillus sp. DJP39]|uniref:HlyD family efflux transporter periplasmic adaptor subunit n=1 Tax=Virgibacillus sp. DJP39 TaxID=3409790 RepID=UPI003BB78240